LKLRQVYARGSKIPNRGFTVLDSLILEKDTSKNQ